MIEKYLEMTGQTRQELFAGESCYGYDFIVNELIPQAIKENKKIVWKDEPDLGLDAMSFELVKI
jgi:hypothetical protein